MKSAPAKSTPARTGDRFDQMAHDLVAGISDPRPIEERIAAAFRSRAVAPALRRPGAALTEEQDGSTTWWTLTVGSLSSPRLSASYPNKDEALADAWLWVGAETVVLVVPLAADSVTERELWRTPVPVQLRRRATHESTDQDAHSREDGTRTEEECQGSRPQDSGEARSAEGRARDLKREKAPAGTKPTGALCVSRGW